MLQSEDMANFVSRYPVQLGLTQFPRRIKRDPALKMESARHMGPCRDSWRFEEFTFSIYKLNRTILSVVFVPIQIENIGPKIHGAPKRFGERRINGSHSHANIQVSRP